MCSDPPLVLQLGVACTDAHLDTPAADRVAMIVEDEAQGVAQLTYRELPELTSRSVQVLRELGVDAGERVLDPPVQPHGLPGGLPGGAHGRSARHLASYNCPRAVHIVADLPRTANGKVLRLSLRRRA